MHAIALLGAGRIAKVHVESIVGHPRTRLAWVVDVDREAAQSMAAAHGARAAVEAEAALADPEVAAIVIASSTPTHSDFIEAGAAAGKHVFCEKPIDLDSARVRACLGNIEGSGAKLFVAFNRRFDPHFRHLKAELDAGAIGRLEQLVVHSRDPGPPPGDYVRASGGLFRDMTIHDLDLARFFLGEEPTALWASASALVNEEIAALGDVDTAVVGLETASGAVAVITNSRRTTYGYDQRIEAHGSEGMLAAGNVPESTLVHGGAHGFTSQKAMHFFLERYSQAYRAEWDHFVDVLDGKAEPSPTGIDGARALAMADAAFESAATGRRIALPADG